ncbi:uncharacterized protein LOC113637532, partial [Tachysurus ichikawai]
MSAQSEEIAPREAPWERSGIAFFPLRIGQLKVDTLGSGRLEPATQEFFRERQAMATVLREVNSLLRMLETRADNAEGMGIPRGDERTARGRAGSR